MLQRGTLQFLKEISGTGESQQSHHPLWLNIHATEKLCDQCPCSLLVNWKRLSCQNSARWKQAHNCCKFRVLSKWTNSPTGGHLLCACTSHKLNLSMKFSPKCQLVATILILPNFGNYTMGATSTSENYFTFLQCSTCFLDVLYSIFCTSLIFTTARCRNEN
jgi:hypothetical protein